MSKAWSFVLFFAVFMTLIAGAHSYAWLRLVRDPGWPVTTQRWLKIALWFLGLSIPLAFVLARSLGRDFAARFLYVPYVWLGVLFLTTVLLLVTDSGRLIHWLFIQVGWFRSVSETIDPERRQTLARLLAGAVSGAVALTSLRSLYNGLGRVQVKRVEVPLARLPAELDGTMIVQLSDLHVGATVGGDLIREVVDKVNELTPDLVVITGDLVDGSVQHLLPTLQPLAELKALHGTYFVTGNHEYYSGATAWCRALPELNVRVLRNENVFISNGNEGFHLAGVDDFASRGSQHGDDVRRALESCGKDNVVVLLAHQPRSVFEAAERGVDLQLSGHTHGGQIFPFNWFVKLVQPVVSGLAKIGDTLVYVSNGTGYWGPPMRLCAPAEITQIVLRASRAVS